MKILVIGASGLVGGHCYNVFKQNGWDVKGTHINYQTAYTSFFNPSDEDIDTNTILKDFDPNIIVHCGALTNVDYCETHEEESFHSTVESVNRLVAYCQQKDVHLVYISTDYVFDGVSGPYYEDAVVNPINVYGKHKYLAEQKVSTLKRHTIVRVTNVYGEEDRAKNFVERLVIWLTTGEEKKLNLPLDQFATPIYAGDIARMLLLLLQDGKRGIYHFGSTDYYTRVQLAEKVKSYYKENNYVKIVGVATAVLNQPAKRPLNGGLLNNKFSKEYPYFNFTSVDSYIIRKSVLK
jgi:dTDP-4-dehydrorhamnose reductase